MALFILGIILLNLNGPWWLRGAIWAMAARLQLKGRADGAWGILLIALCLAIFVMRWQHVTPVKQQQVLLDMGATPLVGYATDVRGNGLSLWVTSPVKSRDWLKIRLNVYDADPQWEGKCLKVEKWTLQPFDQINRTGFQANIYYASRNYDGIAKASLKSVTLLENDKTQASAALRPPFGLVFRYQVQEYFRSRLTPLSPLSQQWMRALIFGEFDDKETLLDSVKSLGVLHLCVVSGFHYTLILSMFRQVTHRLIKWRQWNFVVDGLLAALVYMTAAPGFGSDRAHAKVHFVPLAFAFRRELGGHRGLLVMACVWLLLFPSALLQVGFQVTFIASAALVILSECNLKTLKNVRSSFLKSIVESSFVVMFVMPLLMAHFVEQPVLQVFATVLLSPLVGILLLLGVVFVLLGYGPFGGLLGFAIDVLCQQTQKGVELLLRGGALTWEMPYPLAWQIAAVAIAAIWFWSWPRGRAVLFKSSRPTSNSPDLRGLLRGSGVVLLAVGLLGLCRADYGLSVRTFALKDGEAYLVRAPEGVVLYDVGNDPSLVVRLKQAGVGKIDLLVISHEHQDHRGQLASILQQFNVQNVIEVVPANRTGQRVTKLAFGKLHLTLGQYSTQDENPNENSIALEGVYKDRRFALAGDLEEKGMNWFVQEFWSGSRLNLLKASHHGSYLASYPQWLAIINPQRVWISGGRGKRVNKIPLKGELHRQGVPFCDTMEHGELYWGVMPWPIR